jgi:hypothetical protein
MTTSDLPARSQVLWLEPGVFRDAGKHLGPIAAGEELVGCARRTGRKRGQVGSTDGLLLPCAAAPLQKHECAQ